MAITVSTLVWKLPPHAVTSSERLVLLCLADHAHHDGRNAWPAVGTIAKRTSLSRRAIQKILPKLAGKRFIMAEGVMARGSVRYRLELENLTAAAAGFQAKLDASDREPRSQSRTDHYEPGSQSARMSTDFNSEPRSQGGEPRSPGGEPRSQICEPRSPDPDLNHQKPLEKKEPGADAPAFPSNTDDESCYWLVKQFAAAVGFEFPDLSYEQHLKQVKQRAAAANVAIDAHRLGLAVTQSRRVGRRLAGTVEEARMMAAATED